MNDKTKEQLQRELELRDTLQAERETSDKKYAMKLTEKIVFGFLTAFGLGVTAILVKVVVEYLKSFAGK